MRSNTELPFPTGSLVIKKRPLIIWGSGGQARVLCELVKGQQFEPVAFIDRNIVKSPIEGVVVLRDAEDLGNWIRTCGPLNDPAGALAIGWVSEERLVLGRRLEELGIDLVTLIHDTAWVAHDAIIERGCQILAGARICAGARVQANSIVNTGASIDHDSVVGEGCHIGPGVIVTGEVTIGRNAFLGAGSIVLPRLHVADGAMVGAGAVVTRDVGIGDTVVGVPARPLSKMPLHR